MLAIKNATILTPDEVLSSGTVLVDNGRIQAVNTVSPIPAQAEVIEAEGLTLVPGYIDLQLNGAFGHDFTQNPGSIWEVAARLPQYGVTGFLPTIITSPLVTIEKAQAVMAERPSAFSGAEPLGLHLEGPFLNPQKKGAHNPDLMQPPSLAAVVNWSPEKQVKLVTLAPERPSALEVVAALATRGVVVSAGHSMATFAEAQAGFAAGIRYGTHLFNAMPAIHHREPGLAGALLADDRAVIGLIPDGIHVHPALIKMVWQAAGARLNIVTDAMAALGMPPGQYELGPYQITVDDQSCRLADGTLAGSILSLDTAVRNLISFTGCTLAEAVATVTTRPAALLGLDGQKGMIAPGYDADLVLLTPDLRPVLTIVNGEIVYQAN